MRVKYNNELVYVFLLYSHEKPFLLSLALFFSVLFLLNAACHFNKEQKRTNSSVLKTFLVLINSKNMVTVAKQIQLTLLLKKLFTVFMLHSGLQSELKPYENNVCCLTKPIQAFSLNAVQIVLMWKNDKLYWAVTITGWDPITSELHMMLTGMLFNLFIKGCWRGHAVGNFFCF